MYTPNLNTELFLPLVQGIWNSEYAVMVIPCGCHGVEFR